MRQKLRKGICTLRNIFERQCASFVDGLYFRENTNIDQKKRKINFFVTVWGPHIDLFFMCCVPSLLQPGNAPVLAQKGYPMELVIYTKSPEDFTKIESHTEKLNKIKKYMTVTLCEVKPNKISDKNDILMEAYVKHLDKCYEENAWLVHTPPDMIYGNHSLGNAMQLVEGKDICLAIPYPRVEMDLVVEDHKFNRFAAGEDIFENDELVDFAFKYGHAVLLKAFDHEEENNTRQGLSIRAIGDNSYAVVMSMPGPVVASIKKEDVNFFKYCPSFNHIDKLWSRMLVRKNRIKTVGSSDFAFAVELTKLKKEVKLTKDSLFNDKYGQPSQRLANHFVYNSFYCQWRGTNKDKLHTDACHDQHNEVSLNV